MLARVYATIDSFDADKEERSFQFLLRITELRSKPQELTNPLSEPHGHRDCMEWLRGNPLLLTFIAFSVFSRAIHVSVTLLTACKAHATLEMKSTKTS